MKFLFIILFIIISTSYGNSTSSNKISTTDYPSPQTTFKNSSGFEILLGLGKAYNVINEFEIALNFLQKAEKNAEHDWQFLAVHVELTESFFALGNKTKAKTHYHKSLSFKGKEADLQKRKELSLLFGFDVLFETWTTLETKNIVFHFQDDSIIENIDIYTKDREKAFSKIHKFFNSELPKKIDFFIWKSKDEASSTLAKPLSFTNHRYCVSHTLVDDTKGHEIAHNVAFWSDRAMQINTFINEGIAVYFDQMENDKMLLAKNAIQSQRIDVKKLWVLPEDYPKEILEPLAGAFVEKLILLDKKKFLELCRNQSYSNAKYIYGKDLNTLIREFNTKLNIN